jgi:membrane protease YdiL (CAAX protease family)
MPHTQTDYRTKELEPKNLALFFFIAFAWSWFWWFLFITDVLHMPADLGTPQADPATFSPIILLVIFTPYGPTFAAFLMTVLTHGREGVYALWKRFWNLNLSWRWLLVALMIWPILRVVTNLVGQAAGYDLPLWIYPDQPWILIIPFIASIINGGLSEEFGWRGYALPRLQARWNALISSLILGVIEGLWHAPLLLMVGQRHEKNVLELVFWMTLTIILRTWIFNNTNGSLLAAVLTHAMGNTASDIVYCCGTLSQLYWVYTIFVVLVVITYGPRDLVRKRIRHDQEAQFLSLATEDPKSEPAK